MITFRQARLNADVTQSATEKYVGISHQGLINIEKNRAIPLADTFVKMCKFYKCDPLEIIFLRKNKTKSNTIYVFSCNIIECFSQNFI